VLKKWRISPAVKIILQIHFGFYKAEIPVHTQLLELLALVEDPDEQNKLLLIKAYRDFGESVPLAAMRKRVSLRLSPYIC
jgi:hypothetical protein